MADEDPRPPVDVIESLKAGVDPYDTPLPQEMATYYDLLRSVGAPPSMQDDVADWVERFKNDPEARLRKLLADEADVPYSVALHRWADPDDLAAELGWRALRADDQAGRCSGCGTKPEDWFREGTDGPELRDDDSPWKFYLWDCYGCEQISALNKDLDEDQKAKGTRWIMMQRGPGEDMIDGF